MKTEFFVLAKERAIKFKVRNILVATNSGQSVEKAKEIFGSEFDFFAVGNLPSSRKKGFALHSGILDATKERLEKKGIKVIRQESSIFQTSTKRSVNNQSFQDANRSYASRFSKIFEDEEAVPNNICRVMGHVLAEFFGDGPKVCLEITLMAADSGELPLSEDCLAISTSYGYSNAAVTVHPVKTSSLFNTHFRVKNLLLVPSENDIWFNDGPIP